MTSLSKALIKQGFSRAAKDYDEYAELQKTIAEKLVKFGWLSLKHNGLILDAGCGTGFLKKIMKPLSIVQLDLAESMCAQAANLGPAINGDMEQLPFKDGCVDGVVSSLALQWATDTEQVFREFSRVLKTDGVCLAATFTTHTLQELKSVFRTLDSHAHVNEFFSAEEIIKCMARTGFKDIEIKSETLTREYADVFHLMQNIKRIGASNRQTGRRKSLMTKHYFELLDKTYRRIFKQSNYKITATWEVLYIRASKGIKS